MFNPFKGERGGRIWRQQVGALSAKGQTDVQFPQKGNITYATVQTFVDVIELGT